MSVIFVFTTVLLPNTEIKFKIMLKLKQCQLVLLRYERVGSLEFVAKVHACVLVLYFDCIQWFYGDTACPIMLSFGTHTCTHAV